jgi:predicted small lipoprotein YifL
MTLFTRCAAIGLAVALCGCGQKGPLYVPDDSTPVLVAPEAPASVVPPAGASPGPTPQAQRSKSS